MLPFPNDFFTINDDSTSTGKRLRLTNETFPLSDAGESINATEWNMLDGFSPLPVITSYFADVSLDNIPPHKDIARSLVSNCPTIILDTVTMERVAHWGELDETTKATTERAFMMWPAQVGHF